MRIAACNVCAVCGAGAMSGLLREMDECRVEVRAKQEISWTEKGTVIDRNCMIV